MQETLKRKMVSTGQAAKLCSVTPDTVLKWIKAGKIPASRTAGGHFRINREHLMAIIESGELIESPEEADRKFRFCWEYYGDNDDIGGKCADCIVYRSRALRCYEVSKLSKDQGHAKAFCKSTCDDCEYFRVVQGQDLNILIITLNEKLGEGLKESSREAAFNIRVTDNEYEGSMIVENFRPDYAVIDMEIGENRCAEIAKHLSSDPRIPFVKIIVSGQIEELPADCEGMVFATINADFTLKDLKKLIGTARQTLH
ncbi:MAG: helix-turn-helix domain-containing protein [candidate division Zixibacteria bacterium]|nr:helix-turn-helix domain-containing protein [candidate division Zixibacteria bacterium]